MTQQQLRELVKASNPVVTHALLSEERDLHSLYDAAMRKAGNPQPSVDLLDRPVERRRGMQSHEKPTELISETKPSRTRRRLVPVLSGALAAVVVAVGVWAVTRSTDSDLAAGTPLELGELFNELVATANWPAISELYAADATWQLNTAGGEGQVLRLFDPLPEDAPIEDWDGDGQVTELDFFMSLGGEIYAGGVTTLLSCSQPDAFTAVCEEAREGYAFFNPSHSADWTITITEGSISNIAIDLVGNGADSAAEFSYQLWVEQNRPELVDALFDGGQRVITPDTVDTHRQLVAEWVAQR